MRVVWDDYKRSCEPMPAGHTHLGLKSGEWVETTHIKVKGIPALAGLRGTIET